MSRPKKVLALNRCPVHREFWSISLDTVDGSGTRLTRSKCCGQWQTVRSWPMSRDALLDAAREFEHAAEEVETDT